MPIARTELQPDGLLLGTPQRKRRIGGCAGFDRVWATIPTTSR